MQYRFSSSKMTGLTLIEVLVTLVILSIGLLSMAALQMTGMRSTSSAAHRTQASILANDIAERMRANPAALNANAFMAVDSTNIDCNTLPATYCGEYYDETNGVVAAGNCNATEMAAYDINVWFCGVNSSGARISGVQQSLPQAAATITCIDTNPTGGDADPCTNRSPHTVTVSWTELNPSREGAATIVQSISMDVQP